MSLLIRNVRFAVGAPGMPQRGDVVISGKVISAVGNFVGKKEPEVVDGQGDWLSPGFIDVDSTADRHFSIYDHAAASFLGDGVTTVIGGQCGISLAPIAAGNLRFLEPYTRTKDLHADWESFGSWQRTTKKLSLSENVASFAGYENLIRSLPATHEASPAKLGNQAKRALADGAVGISVPVRRRNGEVVPLSVFEEISNAVKAAGAILAIHMNEGGGDFGDILALMRKCGGRIFVPHALPAYAGEAEVEAIVDFLERARQYADVRLSVPPSPYRVFHLRDFLPATLRLEEAKVVRKALLDAWHAKRILADLPEAFPEELSILRAPGHPFLSNISLRDFTAHYGLDDTREGLLKLFLITGGNATLLAHGRYPRAAQPLLAHTHVLIGSHAPTPPRLEATFASVFTRLEKELGAGFASRKLSGEPARFFGIKNRGEIAEGFAADLVIVRGNRARVAIVNGKVAWFEGAHSGIRAGEPIARRR